MVRRSNGLLLCVLSLCGCGGGGGGGSSTTANSPPGPPDATFSTTTVNFQSQQFATERPVIQFVTVTPRNGVVYLATSGYSSAVIASCPETTRCTIQIPAPNISLATPTTHTESLQVQLCRDERCNDVIRTQAIAIVYTVLPGVQLTTVPANFEITAEQGQAGVQTLALNFANGTPQTISASARYLAGNATDWLSLAATPSSVTATAAPIAPNTYDASVAITYSGPGYRNTVNVPLKYVIRALPSVQHISPSIAVVNEPRTVVIRGRGFDRLSGPVRFGNVDAASVQHIDDTTLLVMPPSFASAGKYTVSAPNTVGIVTDSADYTVTAPQTYAPATVSIANSNSSGLLFKSIAYDGRRHAVYFVKDPEGASRARFVAGTWTVERLAEVNSTHFSISPDGNRLYFLQGTSALEYDLDTNAVVRTYPNVLSRSVAEILIANNGKGLTYDQFDVRLYEFPLERSKTLAFAGLYPRYGKFGPDRSKAIILSDSSNTPYVFDSRLEQIQVSSLPSDLAISQVAVSRHATRVIGGSNVYDGSSKLLGSFTNWEGASGIALSPDDARAYVVFDNAVDRTTKLKIYDCSGTGSSFVQLGATITLPVFSGYAPAITLSDDGRTIFIVGNEQFIVMPTPP